MNYADKPVVPSFLPKTDSGQGGFLHEELGYRQTPLIERLREGLGISEFGLLLDLLKVPEEELGRYLAMSPATLHRRKKSRTLTTPESERVVRFARLFGLAMGVFETKKAAREWLKAPNPGSAGEPPLSYADTEFGAREVENLLGRIDHGVFV